MDCGIYFLITRGQVNYIGKTTNLTNRLFKHKHSLLTWDQVRFIKCREEDLAEYETRWIKRFQPIDNHTHKTKKKKRKLKPIRRPTRHMKFRKLTLKSFLDYGGYREWTVKKMIDSNHHLDLISAYYKLSHITFFDDVLELLKITPEWRIDKPGTDRDKYLEFILSIWPEDAQKRKEIREKVHHKKSKQSLKQSTIRNYVKSYHQRFNQKH